MSLRQQITDDMKTAMRAKDTARLSAIRLLLAAIKQREVDERIELSDADVVAIIEKMNKQRRDSISQYEAAGRQDLADVEKACLLYTSDAADDLLCVDLGGRRIIKKKKKRHTGVSE